MTSNEWSLRKKIIVGLIGITGFFLVIAGIIYGISFANKSDVLVIPVSDADYGSEDDDMDELEGTITTGSSQTIAYDPTKSISEIRVKNGDQVKKGDVLVVYDMTTASDELEQRNLDVKSADLSIRQAQRTLDNLNAAREVIVPDNGDGDYDEDYDDEDEDAKGDTRIGSAITAMFDDVLGEGEEFDDEDTEDEEDEASDDSEDDSDSDDEASQDAESEPDLSEYEPGETVYIDASGEVYTATELRKAKVAAENELRSLTTDLAVANEDLAASQKVITDSSQVVATLDGVVTFVDEELIGQQQIEAADSEDTDGLFFGGNAASGQPVVVVSTFEGIFVNTAVNEWAVSSIPVGSTIYVTDWMSGDTYPATVTEIAQYASMDNSLYDDEGTGDSYYPVKARIEQDGVSLLDGDNVEVSLTKPEDYDDEDEDEDDAIYLYRAFVVTEGNNKYVYKADEEGKLVKQKLTISGKERQTYIVTGGITEDDYIAFPFGDNIREGAKTVKGEIDDLYEDY